MGLLQNLLIKIHRRSGDRFQGMDLLYLTTVGAKTGRKRQVPLTRFPDGDGWLVVASNGGRKTHPGWYHNIRANPGQVWATVGDRELRVRADELTGPDREAAFQRIAAEQKRYSGYQSRTSRTLPILRLSPADHP